ncbi:MAG: DUF2878 domain-containing protein [Gammaproteobacteria bacterium]
MKDVVTNLTMYKIGWVACVLGAASGQPWIGVVAVAVACVIHIASAHTKSKTVLLLVSAALLGLAWESFMVFSGWLDYSVSGHTGNIAPYWIVALWVLFATTLNVGFKWLKGRLVVATLLGAIGGPLAFAAGQRAGAVEFGHPVNSLLAVGLGWAVLMPLLVVLARNLNGHATAEPSLMQNQSSENDMLGEASISAR